MGSGSLRGEVAVGDPAGVLSCELLGTGRSGGPDTLRLLLNSSIGGGFALGVWSCIAEGCFGGGVPECNGLGREGGK